MGNRGEITIARNPNPCLRAADACKVYSLGSSNFPSINIAGIDPLARHPLFFEPLNGRSHSTGRPEGSCLGLPTASFWQSLAMIGLRPRTTDFWHGSPLTGEFWHSHAIVVAIVVAYRISDVAAVMWVVGGPGGVRTLDLMTARHVTVIPGVDSKSP